MNPGSLELVLRGLQFVGLYGRAPGNRHRTPSYSDMPQNFELMFLHYTWKPECIIDYYSESSWVRQWFSDEKKARLQTIFQATPTHVGANQMDVFLKTEQGTSSAWSGKSCRFGAKVTGMKLWPFCFPAFCHHVPWVEIPYWLQDCLHFQCLSDNLSWAQEKEVLVWALGEAIQQEGLGQADEIPTSLPSTLLFLEN